MKKSKYRGVYWKTSEQKWCSQIYYKGMRRYIGVYDTEREAALVYDRVAAKVGRKTNILKKVTL